MPHKLCKISRLSAGRFRIHFRKKIMGFHLPPPPHTHTQWRGIQIVWMSCGTCLWVVWVLELTDDHISFCYLTQVPPYIFPRWGQYVRDVGANFEKKLAYLIFGYTKISEMSHIFTMTKKTWTLLTFLFCSIVTRLNIPLIVLDFWKHDFFWFVDIFQILGFIFHI